MRKVLSSTFIAVCSIVMGQKADADYSRQFVKWNGYTYYRMNQVPEERKSDSKFGNIGVGVGVDVGLDENDIFDAASLYLQLKAEGSTGSSYRCVSNYNFSEYSLRVNLKKFMLAKNNKTRLNFFGGGGIALVQFRHQEYDYVNNKGTFVLNGGVGYAVGSRAEITVQYYTYMNPVFPNSMLKEKKMQSLSLGTTIFLRKNWTYSKIGKYR